MEKQINQPHSSNINLNNLNNLAVDGKNQNQNLLSDPPSSCLNLKGKNNPKDLTLKQQVQQGTGILNQSDPQRELNQIFLLDFYPDQSLFVQLKEIEGDQFQIEQIPIQRSQISVLEMIEKPEEGRNIKILQPEKKEQMIQQRMESQEPIQKNIRKNTNKNTPKSFMKAIANKANLDNIQGEHLDYIMMKKGTVIKIEDLRQFWTNQKYGKQDRIISQNFLRKKSYHWIYNSKVQNRIDYLEDRSMLLQKIKDPFNMKRFKDD